MLRYMTRILREGRTLEKTFRRTVVKESKCWEQKYKKQTRIEIEKYWKEVLAKNWKNRRITSIDEHVRGKFYCLAMFPYPSGKLHMGHVRVYTISDTFAHFYRMRGYKVIHPMGWDSFGLPAENAARDRKLDPEKWTKSNIAYMKKQLEDLNFMFDWEREISTCDPDYYKWTQHLFLKMYKENLAYRKSAQVNWDPVDKTVLADEQVDENGCSWRSGAVVEKKYLKQWFLKTTKYAKSLLDSLHEIDENVGIKEMQRNWIGKIDGCYLNLEFKMDNERPFMVPVFCPKPETIFGASHVVIQSCYRRDFANLLFSFRYNKVTAELKSKESGQLNDCYIVSPFNKAHLPVIISNEYESLYKKPLAVIGIPETDEIAKASAEDYGFKYTTVLDKENYLKYGGKHYQSHEHIRRKALSASWHYNCGDGLMTSSKLHDWLISRQRYWGTPIPIVYCKIHKEVPVPPEDLPVSFPKLKKGENPREVLRKWSSTKCPRCGKPASRETDTMDTFVDSAWYYLRFVDPDNRRLPFSKYQVTDQMPVDLYIGGKEHAILHLYFARFFSHFLEEKKMTTCREPFKKILAQGIIKGKTYQVESTGRYVHSSDVAYENDLPVLKETGEKLKTSFQKMSKSKLNGVDPGEFVETWGISITRLFLLYAASPLEDIHWDVKTDVIPGVMRWQLKIWGCVSRLLAAREETAKGERSRGQLSLMSLEKVEELCFDTNKTIKAVTDHYEKDCVLSAAVTCLMTLTKHLVRVPEEIVKYSPEYERAVCSVVIMSAPMVPHFASELWAGLQLMSHKMTDQDWHQDVLNQSWPSPSLPTNLNLQEYKIQINNKTCHAIRLPPEIVDVNDEVKSALLQIRKVKNALKNSTPQNFSLNTERSIINISAD